MSEPDLSIVTDLYCDGGVVWDGSPGASTIGGTWAWVAVDKDDQAVTERSGFVAATATRPVTNNHMEQIAIILALEAMPLGWSGCINSDSQIALGRVFLGWREKNLPTNISDRTKDALWRAGALTYRILQGHPTKADLEVGIGKRKGLPVSIHNHRCDTLCNEAKGIVIMR